MSLLSSSTKRLLLLLGLKALVLIFIILYAGIELGPDEAQYWTWSQALDWGYYSKPPGIAWQIWLGTRLFGQTEWGVRSLSVLLAILQAFAVYRLALQAGLLSRTAFWCGLMMALCPLGVLGSFLAITDVGFLLCWTGACLTVVTALNDKRIPSSFYVGGWILVGALFKWPIYCFWIFFLFAYCWYFPNEKKGRLLAGILFSLLGLLPSIWWNGTHDWATFRHVWATLQGGSGPRAAGNWAEWIGSQALLISPILFGLLLCGCWKWWRHKNELSPPLFFCGFVTLVSLSFAFSVACFQKIQGNWVSWAYPTGFVVLGWYAFQHSPQRASGVKVGVGLSIGLMLLIFLLPSFYLQPRLSYYYTPPYFVNPFKHNLGWDALQQALSRHGYQPHRHFLFSDKYQMASVLSFYGKGQKRAYFLNLHGVRKNQFSYWPSLQEEQQGKVGYFVWTENMPTLKRNWLEHLQFYQRELQHYFEKVEFLELVPLVYERHTIAKAAFIFRCDTCRNVKPLESALY